MSRPELQEGLEFDNYRLLLPSADSKLWSAINTAGRQKVQIRFIPPGASAAEEMQDARKAHPGMQLMKRSHSTLGNYIVIQSYAAEGGSSGKGQLATARGTVMKKYLILIVVIGVLLAAGYYYMKGAPESLKDIIPSASQEAKPVK